ncbi:MAG: type VI secretion system tip protein VgrG [Deltaproteobacteria bacterium]|nr:type VI secretion system tip protein VgrG [Deltaproteobacteria bacterium]
MHHAELSFEHGGSSLEVRHMRVREAVNELFRVRVLARSPDEHLELAAFVGHGASLRLASLLPGVGGRTWSGLCVSMRAAQAEDSEQGLATYEVELAPRLWLLTQRRTHRHYQHQSIPEIVAALLADWAIEPELRLELGAYPKLELRTQAGETDFAFFSRLLEEAGISYFFEDAAGSARLVLDDAPQRADARRKAPLPFTDEPGQAYAARLPFVTALRVQEDARPGAVVLRDYDHRNPRFHLFAAAFAGERHERQYEQYHFAPGEFTREGDFASGTPVADDLGVARSDAVFGEQRARVALEALRTGRRRIVMRTNVLDLAAGSVFAVVGHPRADVVADALFARSFEFDGKIEDAWTIDVEALPVGEPFRPAQRTPKPRVNSLHVAVVVGPEPGSIPMTGAPLRALLPGMTAPEGLSPSLPGEDVYADEHGRVRVQFPWDRESSYSQASSVWMRVAQSWAGPGHGLFSIPRIGTEVLVAFLDGDPDSPIVVGTLHNMVQPAPFKLPENKSVTTWRTATSPGGLGSNEIRFDDTVGREHVYLQAEQDMDHLVKNDKQEAVGRDRAAFVQRDETRAVGHDLLDVVKSTATSVVGVNVAQAVGLARSTTVGVEDATQVGSRWSVSIARGLSARLGPKLGQLFDGPLGTVLAAPATSVLGAVTKAPLGGVQGGGAAALATFRSRAPGMLMRALGIGQAVEHVEGPPPTTIEMVDRRIELTTGEASIILDGPNISLRASGNIVLDAMKSVSLVAEEEVALAARERLAALSLTDDVILQAARTVHLNPFAASAVVSPPPRAESVASPPMPREPSSDDLE